MKKQGLRNNEYYNMQEIFDKLYKQSKEGQQFRHLIEIISSKENILLAFRNIKKNKGRNTPGVDNVTMEYFEKMEIDEFVLLIQRSISKYRPGKVKRVEIPKPDGKTRPLGIPCMKDRIMQQCILQVLDPICEAKFYNYSFGFRPNRSAHHAVERAKSLINVAHLHYVVDVDIKGFFDNIDHGKLLKQIWTLGIRDKNLLSVISKILKAEIEGIGISTKGVPQGGTLSPLLANIALNEFDWWISDQWNTFKSRFEYLKRGYKYKILKSNSKLKEIYLVRYADDFKIFCRTDKVAFKIFNATKLWLKERLKLEINPDKSTVTNLRKRYTNFLGFKLKAKIIGKNKRNKPKWVCISGVSDKAISNIKDKLLSQIKYIQKNPKYSVYAMNLLNSMILGIHNYYSIASQVSKDFRKIYFYLIGAIRSRLKPNTKGEHSKAFIKLYSKYCKRKVIKVASVDMYPIHGISMKNTYNFNQKICNYNEEGRALIHKQIHKVDHLVKHLLETSMKDPVKYTDNRISLLHGQQGKCSITRLNLYTDNMHCHHIIPKSQGGTDDYKNLVYVEDFVHRLIHATSMKTYQALWEQLVIKMKLNTTSEFETVLKRINHYRILAKNFTLILKAGISVSS